MQLKLATMAQHVRPATLFRTPPPPHPIPITFASIRDKGDPSRTILHLAASLDKPDWVKALSQAFPTMINQPDGKGRTPLYDACCAKSLACVRELLQVHAKVCETKWNDWDPLSVAAAKGDVDIVRLLLESKQVRFDNVNREGNTALHLAAREGHEDIVRLLLTHNDDELARTQLQKPNHNNRTPIFCAIRSGSVATMLTLLQYEDAHVGNVDSSGSSLLHEMASHVFDENDARIIMQNMGKAFLHHHNNIANQQDHIGRTPLHVACDANNIVMARLLLQGDDIISPAMPSVHDNNGTTPLMVAAIRGHCEIINLVADYNGDVHIMDNMGRTALDLAKAWGKKDAMELLCVRGAPTITLNTGYQMPMLFLGTYKLGTHTKQACLDALRRGYRGFDCAAFYGNEKEVGDAIRESGVRREAIFVTSKIWNDDVSRGTVVDAVNAMLTRFGLQYLDAILVHWPVKDRYVDAFDCLCGMADKVRSPGVSNFTVQDLETLKQLPAINQIELNVFLYRPTVLKWCRERGVAVQAYRTLACHRDLNGLNHPIVMRIANQVNRTAPQVLNRWVVQKGAAICPKSTSETRIRENANVWDFELGQEEEKLLDELGGTDGMAEMAWMASVYKGSVVKDVVQ